MRWREQRQSTNIEDRRGMGRSVALGGGGLGVLILAAIVCLLGGDPRQFLESVPSRDRFSNSSNSPLRQTTLRTIKDSLRRRF